MHKPAAGGAAGGGGGVFAQPCKSLRRRTGHCEKGGGEGGTGADPDAGGVHEACDHRECVHGHGDDAAGYLSILPAIAHSPYGNVDKKIGKNMAAVRVG